MNFSTAKGDKETTKLPDTPDPQLYKVWGLLTNFIKFGNVVIQAKIV